MENKRTCLYKKHVALQATMAPFAGYDMPIRSRFSLKQQQEGLVRMSPITVPCKKENNSLEG